MSPSAGIAPSASRWRCAPTAARPSRTTASSERFRGTRCCACSSRPGARTRSACTWRTSAIPLVGDPVYGGRRARHAWRGAGSCWRRCAAFKRQALHAARLELAHPVSGKALDVRGAAAAGLPRCWPCSRGCGAAAWRSATPQAPQHAERAAAPRAEAAVALLRPDWPAPPRVRAASRCAAAASARRPWRA